MTMEYDIRGMAEKIQELKKNVLELKTISGGIPAVDRNIDRILADIRLLEINISDAADLIQ